MRRSSSSSRGSAALAMHAIRAAPPISATRYKCFGLVIRPHGLSLRLGICYLDLAQLRWPELHLSPEFDLAHAVRYNSVTFEAITPLHGICAGGLEDCFHGARFE